MQAIILAFPRKGEDYLAQINGEPMIRIVERRVLLAKRIDTIYTKVPKGQLRRYSLHVSNPVRIRARSKPEALYKALPKARAVFLIEGNMPLVMPFLVNYLSILFLEGGPDALIPVWRDGTPEVTHAFYDASALRNALEACLAENKRRLSSITEYLDYEKISVEELLKRNPKVALSFFKVRNSFDLKFAGETLKKLK